MVTCVQRTHRDARLTSSVVEGPMDTLLRVFLVMVAKPLPATNFKACHGRRTTRSATELGAQAQRQHSKLMRRDAKTPLEPSTLPSRRRSGVCDKMTFFFVSLWFVSAPEFSTVEHGSLATSSTWLACVFLWPYAFRCD